MPPQVVTVRNAGKVAAALQNEKCRRILDHLGTTKDATETELAEALKIPLSTVHYTMKVLAEANLVHNDVYSYSSRGKQVTHYRLNRNPIVIVQEEAQLEGLKALVPAALVAAGVGIAYHLATRAPVMDAAIASAPAADVAIMATGIADEAALRTMEAAPELLAKGADVAAFSAPAMDTTVHATAQAGFLPAFIMGVLAVLVLGFLATLVIRWWDRRT
jgi:DNA-binding transcriptional ArsR family regulator